MLALIVSIVPMVSMASMVSMVSMASMASMVSMLRWLRDAWFSVLFFKLLVSFGVHLQSFWLLFGALAVKWDPGTKKLEKQIPKLEIK